MKFGNVFLYSISIPVITAMIKKPMNEAFKMTFIMPFITWEIMVSMLSYQAMFNLKSSTLFITSMEMINSASLNAIDQLAGILK